MTPAFRIRNWSQYQHYRDRNPPWIKLHISILASEDWVMLDDASKLLAIVCMMVASRHDGTIPDNPGYIQRVAYLSRKPNFKPLIDCGFLEPLADASTLLADARPEKETYSNKSETETEDKVLVDRAPKKARAAKSRSEFPDEMFPNKGLEDFALQFWGVHARFDLATRDALADQIAQFEDHHRKIGSTMADWPAAWRTWVRNALKFSRHGANSGNGKLSAHDKGTLGAAMAIAEIERRERERDNHGAGTPRDLLPEG